MQHVDPEHLARLKAMYEAAPTNEADRPTISVSAGEAEVVMRVQPSQFHAAQAVHGAHYVRLLDDAAFFAANSLVRDVFVLTVSLNVNFLLGVTEGTMRAVGEVKHFGKRLIFADSVLYDRRHREVARGSGVFVRSNVKLKDIAGYTQAEIATR